MGWWLLFAVFLYWVCAALLVAEVFVPSGGILSVCAFVALIGGVLIFFQQSPVIGWMGIGVGIVMIPTVWIITYRWLPKTRFGKNVTLQHPNREIGDAVADMESLKQLQGAEGVVLTPLRPVGMCDFSGRRIECVAESGYVEKGLKVKVVAVQSTQLTVRVVQES